MPSPPAARLHARRRALRRLLGAGMIGSALLSGCTARIDQQSFFPSAASAPATSLRAPAGYNMSEAMLELPGLGTVHAVRLDNPASDTIIVYNGGNMSFVAGGSRVAAALAGATGADLILYDYPGRGGTDLPRTIDVSIQTGPALLRRFREAGWIGSGPLFTYGFSFGGSQAAAMSREGGVAGIVLEATAADIAAVGRNFVPALVRPFVKLEVDRELKRFDYLGYAVASGAPLLLIASVDDDVVRLRNMRDFAEQLRSRGAQVTLVEVPGGHGSAVRHPTTLAAVRTFVEQQAGKNQAPRRPQ